MKSTFRLVKIAGIEIGIHFSWFFILALITWSLARSFFPVANPAWSEATRWGLGLISALLLFLSVLIHELAHSIVAKSKGYPVEGITLFLLGGVSNLQAEARRAKDEFVISAVGPATSLVLAVLFLLILGAIGGDALDSTPLVLEVRELSPLQAILGYLWVINLLLAFFNMVPAFPLDGGRVLRSVIWAFSGNFAKATKISARIGQAAGLALIAAGVSLVIWLHEVSWLWIALIGWFLQSAAGSTLREMEVEAVMKGVHVRDVMRPSLASVDPGMSVFDVVYDHLMQDGVRAMPVCEGDRLAGIVSLTDVKKVERDNWPTTPVRDIMTPIPVLSVEPQEDLSDALGLLAENSIHQSPVLYEGRLIGMVTRADIIEYLHRRKELGIDQPKS
ncbi:MAG: hypothetical protein BZY79_00190 [SAR202 cluster bacterium Casp-Chloro-G4]|nr:site-2 protease family protein [Chloroflexota bacterium]MDA1227389.1 site-2 protease family protein [Chloroflexota bacterium]PKB62164.1 MAG: hypothetical protein BZY79_00190 [SAR202 cluster bacterium Casp-Chloro-G4]